MIKAVGEFLKTTRLGGLFVLLPVLLLYLGDASRVLSHWGVGAQALRSPD